MLHDVDHVCDDAVSVLGDVVADPGKPRGAVLGGLEVDVKRPAGEVLVNRRGVGRDDIGQVVRPRLFPPAIWRFTGQAPGRHHVRELLADEIPRHVVHQENAPHASRRRNHPLHDFVVVVLELLLVRLYRFGIIEGGALLHERGFARPGSILGVDDPERMRHPENVKQGRHDERLQEDLVIFVRRVEEFDKIIEILVVRVRPWDCRVGIVNIQSPGEVRHVRNRLIVLRRLPKPLEKLLLGHRPWKRDGEINLLFRLPRRPCRELVWRADDLYALGVPVMVE